MTGLKTLVENVDTCVWVWLELIKLRESSVGVGRDVSMGGNGYVEWRLVGVVRNGLVF